MDTKSQVMSAGMTLKEYYSVARAWDPDNNAIDDAQERTLTSGAKSVGLCERLMKRTGVFVRMDDKEPITHLPMLSVVLPTAAHGDFIRVLYAGRLTGYIHADALTKQPRTLDNAEETDKWVTAPGKSLQTFLTDAFKTQGITLHPGQSASVKDGALVMNNTSNEPFAFETNGTIDIPTTGANGAFGIRFRLTRTLERSPLYSSAWDPSIALTGRRVGWHEEGWDDLRFIEVTLNYRWAQPGNKQNAERVSGDPMLQSGQLYELRFPDGTGTTTLITLPDGTIVDKIGMIKFWKNLTGGFFPDHKISLCIGDESRSSVTISDLEFIVPPTP